MLRTERGFFPVFLGTLIAGAVPVPIYPPFRPDQIEEYAHRQRVILRNAGARVLVTFEEALRVARLLRGAVPSLEHITTIDGLGEGATTKLPTQRGSGDPALIQYTSGSTGDPKGILLSHANILANIRAIGQALAVRPDDVTVSWLPLYHDMGLIGAWLGSLYHGVPLVLLSPLAFLSRPSRPEEDSLAGGIGSKDGQRCPALDAEGQVPNDRRLPNRTDKRLTSRADPAAPSLIWLRAALNQQNPDDPHRGLLVDRQCRLQRIDELLLAFRDPAVDEHELDRERKQRCAQVLRNRCGTRGEQLLRAVLANRPCRRIDELLEMLARNVTKQPHR
jgi:hypothetical protein